MTTLLTFTIHGANSCTLDPQTGEKYSTVIEIIFGHIKLLFGVVFFSGLLTILDESRDNLYPKAYRLPAIFDVKQWIGPRIPHVHEHV